MKNLFLNGWIRASFLWAGASCSNPVCRKRDNGSLWHLLRYKPCLVFKSGTITDRVYCNKLSLVTAENEVEGTGAFCSWTQAAKSKAGRQHLNAPHKAVSLAFLIWSLQPWNKCMGSLQYSQITASRDFTPGSMQRVHQHYWATHPNNCSDSCSHLSFLKAYISARKVFQFHAHKNGITEVFSDVCLKSFSKKKKKKSILNIVFPVTTLRVITFIEQSICRGGNPSFISILPDF